MIRTLDDHLISRVNFFFHIFQPYRHFNIFANQMVISRGMVGSSGSSRIMVFFMVSSLLLMTFHISPEVQGDDQSVQTPGALDVPDGFSVSICNWKDNKSGALSITYDDGLSSQIENASRIMSLLDLNGTFFVTTDNVGIPYGGTWSQWQSVVDDGHEIASHSKSHPDLTTIPYPQLYEEVVDTKRSIEENLTNVKCQTFSYPMGLYNETVMDLVRTYYLAARQDRHNITDQPAPVPSSPADMYSIVPVDFGSGETASDLNTLLDQTISSGDWLVEMIHAVGSGGYDPVDIVEFTSHIQYSANSRDDVWIAPFSNVSKYIQIRDSAVLNVTHPESYLLDIVLETPLSEAYFDLPVTLNVSFPEDWFDLEIWRRGAPFIRHTIDADDHRYLMVELRANERIRIVQANMNPSIEIYNPDQKLSVPFFPVEGGSTEVYYFYLNYTSIMNRPPANRPLVWFDLNGDGDLDDIVNEFQEGRLNMSKVEMTDIDYTDGCIFFIENWFPPGTNLKIRFSVTDVEGLEGVSSTGMGGWMDGPFLNDPPKLDGGPFIQNLHDPSPLFSWEEGNDPDDDPVTYDLVLRHKDGIEIWNTTTNMTSLRYPERLDFFMEYHIFLWCRDDRGEISDTNELIINLSNGPPAPIENVIVEFKERSTPIFVVSPSSSLDPDEDPVTTTFELFDSSPVVPVRIFIMSQEDNTSFDPGITLKDHTNYTVRVWNSDPFGHDSIHFVYEFYLNIPPAPISRVYIHDQTDQEDALLITWDENPEDDLSYYSIHRFNSIQPPTDLTSADLIYNVTGNTIFVDLNVTDGDLYWYLVVGVDIDGEHDLHSAVLMNGTPIDDLDPAIVNDLKVTFQEQDAYYNARVLIEWNASGDGRFLGYRIYRSLEPMDDVENLTPIRYHNGTRNMTSIWDYNIEKNQTYYYAATAVDIFGNEMVTDLSWVSGTYLVPSPPELPVEEEKESKYSELRNSIFWASIGAIFLLLIGIIYLSFILMQRKSHYYDGLEE
jgi:peptidoglycan/xylan/chitin deacetylase (PgdA/CDA1 family)